MPFFSVIIPTYNRAFFLIRTLQSVQNQTFHDFEIILVDDGSTDETPTLIPQTFHREPRLRYFRKKNEERSLARNFGMQKAKGDYFYFLDSDDFMHEHHLETLYQKIIQNPHYQIFATKYKIKHQTYYQTPTHFHFPEKEYSYEILLEGNVLGSMLCIKKSMMPFHSFNPKFNMCEDWIFNILNMKNHPFYLIDQWTITVLEHENRSMANHQKAIQGRIAAMKYLQKNTTFTPKELKILRGHSYRFCAIHAYLAQNKRQGFYFWKQMVGHLGINRIFLILIIKIFVGKKIISFLQDLLK